MFMFTNQNVDVIRHNDTRITGVFFVRNYLAERIGKLWSNFRFKRSPWMFQNIGGCFQKPANNGSRRLNFLSSVVQIAKLSEDIVADAIRTAAARIVGEPTTVRGSDQMMRDDDWFVHNVLRTWMLSAKPQAAMQSEIAACGLALNVWFPTIGATTISLKRHYL